VDNDRVIRLLEEIRDLQRSHVENYKEAIRNQQESIQLNKEWQRRASRRQLVILVVFAVAMLALMWPWLRR
jgi:hypothetical protein